MSKNANARQQIPAPTILPPVAVPKMADPVMPPPKPQTPSGGIDLIDPIIEIDKHRFIPHPKTGLLVQTDKIEPKRAVIVDGAVVIDELGLIFPLSSCFIRTKRS